MQSTVPDTIDRPVSISFVTHARCTCPERVCVDACLVAAAGLARRRVRKNDDDDHDDGRMQVEEGKTAYTARVSNQLK